MKREKMVKAIDDWYPCFPDSQVQASLHKDGKGSWRVAVWGEDDFGMEKGSLEQAEAFSLFRSLANGISQAILKEKGFVQA
jgi:hypothetical protein